MEMTKGRITQIVIGGLALIQLVMSILFLGGIIQTGIAQWVLAILLVCFGFIIIEVMAYFLFTKKDILEMICKWLIIFFGVIVLVMNTVLMIMNAATIFTNFLALTGWLALVFILLTYALCAAMIAYLVIASKEERTEVESSK